LYYTAAAIASFAVRLITGRASDRYGRGLFITISLVLYTLSMFMLWQSRSAAAFLIASTVEGAGFGILIPMFSALIADRSEPQERGRIFGLCLGGFDLGIAIAGPILGSVAAEVGYRSIFGLAGGLALLGLVVFMTQVNKDLPRSLKFALGQDRDNYALDTYPVKT
jgi:MFS family permease